MTSEYKIGALSALFQDGDNQVCDTNFDREIRHHRKKVKQAFASSNVGVKAVSITPARVTQDTRELEVGTRRNKTQKKEFLHSKLSGVGNPERSTTEATYVKRDDPEKVTRTLFVGNLPPTFQKKKKVKKLFKPFGQVESIRFRSSFTLTGNPHSEDNRPLAHFSTYVVMSSPESSKNALALNGTEVEGNVIRVNPADHNHSHDHNKSVYICNLSYHIIDDEIWNFFKDCGTVQNVRVIRDPNLGVGKGFGYVLFDSEDGVMLALQKNGQPLKGRAIQVRRALSDKQMKKNSRRALPHLPQRRASKYKCFEDTRTGNSYNFKGYDSKQGREMKKKILKKIRHPRKRNTDK